MPGIKTEIFAARAEMNQRLHLTSWLLLIAAAGCTSNASLPDPLAAGWQGREVCENLHEDKTQRILRCTFPPGIGHERHYHAAHYGYIVNGGRMQITDSAGVRVVDITAGKGFASSGVSWHEALNVGDSTVVVLIMEGK